MIKKISPILVVLAVVMMMGSLALAYPQPRHSLSPPGDVINDLNTTDDQSPPISEFAAIPGFCLTNNSLTQIITDPAYAISPATNSASYYVNMEKRIAELIMTRFAPTSKNVDIFGMRMEEFGTFGGFYIGDQGEGGNFMTDYRIVTNYNSAEYPSTGDMVAIA